MHVPDLKHEFKISPYILLQIFICGIHKVMKFAPRDVVGIPQDKFNLNAVLEELPSVAMALPFLLSHCSSPCGDIAFQVGLGKLHDRMSSNLGGMYIILHLRKPNIHNLSVTGTIKVSELGQLISHIFG